MNISLLYEFPSGLDLKADMSPLQYYCCYHELLVEGNHRLNLFTHAGSYGAVWDTNTRTCWQKQVLMELKSESMILICNKQIVVLIIHIQI